MRSRRRRAQAARTGAQMLEFAIVLPIFLLALVGILEFGRAFMVNQVVISASRSGARKAVIQGVTDDAVKTAVKDEIAANAIHLADSQLKIKFYVDGTETSTFHDVPRGSQVGVRVQLPYSAVAVTHPMFMTAATLSGETIMRRE